MALTHYLLSHAKKKFLSFLRKIFLLTEISTIVFPGGFDYLIFCAFCKKLRTMRPARAVLA